MPSVQVEAGSADELQEAAVSLNAIYVVLPGQASAPDPILVTIASINVAVLRTIEEAIRHLPNPPRSLFTEREARHMLQFLQASWSCGAGLEVLQVAGNAFTICAASLLLKHDCGWGGAD